jgi:hypothetical protein
VPQHAIDQIGWLLGYLAENAKAPEDCERAGIEQTPGKVKRAAIHQSPGKAERAEFGKSAGKNERAVTNQPPGKAKRTGLLLTDDGYVIWW